MDALYNIKRKKYKTVCAELAFAKVTFDRMVMIFYRTSNVFFICPARAAVADLFTTTFSPYLLRFFTVNYALRLNLTYHHGHKPTVIDLKRTIKQGGRD